MAEQYLYLTTTGWKSGKAHRIEIWFVELAGRYYIVAEHGTRAHWVQNVLHQLRVTFQVGSQTFQGTSRVVDRTTESELAGQVAALMDKKYEWSDGLIVELTPDQVSKS